MRVLTSLLLGLGLVGLGPTLAHAAADTSVSDRYGQYVRVDGKVVDKLKTKHNLEMKAVKALLPKAKLANKEGTSRTYTIRIVKLLCTTTNGVKTCKTTNEKEELKFVVDYRINSQGKQQGLVTGYCLGKTKCPSWVNNPSTTPPGNGGGGGGGW
ncbi:MAG: hypothetical protein QM628_15630 [Propionicimonas sp.]